MADGFADEDANWHAPDCNTMPDFLCHRQEIINDWWVIFFVIKSKKRRAETHHRFADV